MWDFDKYKNKVAVISDKGQVISYGELNNRIRKIKACICDRALVAMYKYSSLFGFLPELY